MSSEMSLCLGMMRELFIMAAAFGVCLASAMYIVSLSKRDRLEDHWHYSDIRLRNIRPREMNITEG